MANRNQDWDDLGRNIQNIVDQAVNSKDFEKLNQTIRQTVDQAVDVGSDALRRAVDTMSTGYQAMTARKLYTSTLGKKVKGIVKLICGVPLSLFSSLALAGSTLSAEPVTLALLLPIIAMLGGGLWLGITGGNLLGTVKRFKAYRNVLGNKTYSTLKKLAAGVDKKEAFVRKDLYKMIGQGYFREGHMNKEETILITSNETFQYFEQSRLLLEERQREEAALQAQTAAAQPRDQRVQEVLNRGNEFLAQLRKCNDDIPGVEISNKIERIELIIQRIFQRVEGHPEIIPDLKKLMDYYLPMTIKLLNAYADMDAQPVQGQTILASKREIEQTLDTLNLAYEKLLDSVFADTAMDVSSDISVLNTLLAQEGLTEDELSKMKQQSL